MSPSGPVGPYKIKQINVCLNERKMIKEALSKFFEKYVNYIYNPFMPFIWA